MALFGFKKSKSTEQLGSSSALDILTGSVIITTADAAKSTAYVDVTFEKPFASPPVMIVSADTGNPHIKTASSYNVTNTGARIYVGRIFTGGSNTTTVYWAAIGKKA